MKVFVTVGSTKFDGLISQIYSNEFIEKLEWLGYSQMTVQYGGSAVIKNSTAKKLKIINYD